MKLTMVKRSFQLTESYTTEIGYHHYQRIDQKTSENTKQGLDYIDSNENKGLLSQEC